jgi:carbonic anhydrase
MADDVDTDTSAGTGTDARMGVGTDALHQLLAGNAAHVESLPEGHFAEVLDDQHPAAVSVCCSDSRVSQEGMWDVDRPGWLFTPSTIGNQAWDRHEDERVVDGSVLYPLAYTGTDVVAVVGHTGCGAVAAALAATEGESDHPPGVAKWVELLEPVVEEGLARADPDDPAGLVNQLVEHNVDRQVEFLLERQEVPGGVTVYGFVYDFQGAYGDTPGRAYLVNADGETDPAALRAAVPAEFTDHVARLL